MLMSSPQKACWSHIYHWLASISVLLDWAGGCTHWGFPNLDIYITNLTSPHPYSPHLSHTDQHVFSLSPVSRTFSLVLLFCQTIPPSLLPSFPPVNTWESWGRESGHSSLTSLLCCWASPALTFQLHAVQCSVTRGYSALCYILISHLSALISHHLICVFVFQINNAARE